MKTSQQGFTLIESLLVLSIFLIISSVTIFSVKPQYERTNSEAFLTQLQADLFYAQQYAISHQKEISINFIPDQHYYYIRDRYDLPLVVERHYSQTVFVSPGSLPLYFKFLPDGNASKFGSIYIKCGSKHFRLTVLLGMGRFYVIEE
ncbi:competence type IV pilus minor pilin ComGD [Neobacillus sp. PS3-40]|jgi:competence protein ComGD|uniref:competence type IV pilus minor pilin ComGD n=1 Tax=Neobacillus sp. PS3-40 TaxID=3070679 RepID=UPI0027DF35DA|nr:competence type IV pilus minor pilin ComGD [Neobacillus sp. PS3-40]WML45292.1 competence type IV pilus minor pilin ComGD [Neobacillus sp. PS3-40]